MTLIALDDGFVDAPARFAGLGDVLLSTGDTHPGKRHLTIAEFNLLADRRDSSRPDGLSVEKHSEAPIEIEKGLSPNFGRRKRRQAQLMRRLRGVQNYANPVPGGTGKQYRTRRAKFNKGLGVTKHFPGEHDQKSHGNRGAPTVWGEGFKVFPYQSSTGTFHFVGTTRSKPKTGQEATLCGLDTSDMRAAASFPVGDRRNAVHVERGCDTCIDILSEAPITKHANHDQSTHGNWARGHHGTAWKNVESIKIEGFKIPVDTNHGWVWGQGVYLASTSEQADYWAKLGYSWSGEFEDAPFVLEVEIPDDMQIFRYVHVDSRLPGSMKANIFADDARVGIWRADFLEATKTKNPPEVVEVFKEAFEVWDASPDRFSPTSNFGNALAEVLAARGFHALEVVAHDEPDTQEFVTTGGHQLVVFDPEMAKKLTVVSQRMAKSKKRRWFVLAIPD